MTNRKCAELVIAPAKEVKTMAIQVRRVVTGHDAKGRAVVKIDEVSRNIVSNRPGATACVVWTTESFPVDNTGDG